MIVLIPAYEPGPHLVPLVLDMLERDPDVEVMVVDDGSGAAYADLFDEAEDAGATVVHHSANRGKGAALKTGFRAILDASPGEDVVTADADGQHTVDDIERVAEELRADAANGRVSIVLGARGFSGDVPLRSRFGNAVSRGLFRVAAGWRASDTQTGLRGIPSALLSWLLEVPGERFEYEIEMLLRLGRAGHEAHEIPIETVYLDDNSASHFRPIIDSLRVTVPLLLFASSSLLAFLVDTLALLLLTGLTGSLVFSIVTARVVSATVNFAVNRRFVFRRHRRTRAVSQAVRYALLAALLLASNIVWMNALTGVGLPLLVAKVITEAVLFVTSYQVQRRFVFSAGAIDRPPRAAGHPQDGRVGATQEAHRSRIAPSGRMDTDPPRFERTP